MTTVQKIHHEFDTAEDRLLSEAMKIISDPIENKKAEKLEKIGFVNAKGVSDISKNRLSIVENMAQANLINYYKKRYPFLKFITESELKRICGKYGLVYMPVENYAKDVPMKNILDIERTQPRKSEDAPSDRLWCKLKRDNSFSLVASSGGSWCGIWGTEWYRIPKIIEGRHFTSQYRASEWLREEKGFTTEYLVDKVTNYTENRQGLFIAAPKSHFKGKNKSISIFEVKDPIVFRFVNGGIQVITKWGDEAADAALLNEIDN